MTALGPPGGNVRRRVWVQVGDRRFGGGALLLVYPARLAQLLPSDALAERMAGNLPRELGEAGFLPLRGAACPDLQRFLER